MGDQKKKVTKKSTSKKEVAEVIETKETTKKTRKAKKTTARENIVNSFKQLKWYEWIMIIVMIVIAGYELAMSVMAARPGSNVTSAIPVWLAFVNFISAVAGVVCITLCARASITNFVFGIVNTLAYIAFLAYSKIWGTMLLEALVYIPSNCISWYLWSQFRDKENPQNTLAKKMDGMQIFSTLTLIAAGTGLVYAALLYAGGDVPLFDAFTVTLGIAATFIQILRFREQYIWWAITDIVAIGMYISHFDPVYLTKKSIYLIVAILGFINWTKMQKARNKENK